MKTVLKDTDHTLKLTIIGSDGSPINLDNADDITVKLFQKSGEEMKTYNVGNGVEITNASLGKCSVYVKREVINVSTTVVGEIIVDIDDTNFTGNVKRNKIKQELFKIA